METRAQRRRRQNFVPSPTNKMHRFKIALQRLSKEDLQAHGVSISIDLVYIADFHLLHFNILLIY